ncbi:MAG: Dihydroorotate dehydrogenase-like protein [uncultured Paraburkholderia sp.]|nr:MAG: Dihydroorotate dehydrogenase-like protein [uncultured Paraburkholderia sp.]
MISVDFLGLQLRNAILVGSGLLTDQERNIRRLIQAGAGGVVTKTIHPSPPRGLDERVFRIPTGMLNSTTYSKRSVEEWIEMLRHFASDRLPVIASIHADKPADLADLASQIAQSGVRALELGISCINEEDGIEDTPQRIFAYTVAVRKATTLPFLVKLGIGEGLEPRLYAAIAGGANAITLSDTIPAATISPVSKQPELGGVFGYSGPALRPLVVAAIWRLRQKGHKIPISGSGGVTTGLDVHEYLNAGANTVQVYTALHTRMIDTLQDIVSSYRGFSSFHAGSEQIVADNKTEA